MLLLGWADPACGQPAGQGFPPLRNFSKEEYGAGTQNWGIVQNPQGLFYVANNKGLLEFDGENWSLYPVPNRTVVHSLAADGKGRIYAGGQADFGYFEPDARGRMTYTSLSDRVPPEFQTFEDVWHIFLLSTGALFATSEALFWLPSEAGSEAQVYPARNRFDGFFEVEGRLHVWERGVGLQAWAPEGLALLPQGEQFAQIPVSGLLEADSACLVVTRDEGLFRLEKGQLSPWASEASALLSEAGVFSALRLSDGRYALGSIRQGLVLLDAEGSLLFRLDQSRGLANNTILSLYEDRSQNLWMGMDNGLACLEMRSPFSYIDERVGVFGSGYAAALFGGQLLLGTNQGIFAAAWGDPARNAVQEPFRILPESPGQVWSFHTEEDYIWVGRHRGAFRLQGSDLEVLSRADGFWSLWMLAGDSGLALAGAYNGLHLFRRSDVRSPWRYDRPLRGFDESSRVLAQDAEGYVWVSHAYKGIYRLRLSANGDSIAERSYFHSPDGLPADYLVNVARVRGELLFTTPAGIYRFDASSQRFAPDTAFNKALGGARPVYRLIEDAFGDIWFSQEGEFGYLHFRQQGLRQIVEKHLINPLHRQMLDGFEFVLRLAPDQALIGTEKGFIHCRLEDAALGAAAFPVFLRRVASLTQPGSSLFEGTWAGSADAAALRLGSQENNLRFAFAALPDMGSRPCQYRYRLEGLERQWSEWQEEHYKEYTNLPPGAYYFHVEARDAFGRTGAPLRFPFRIYPPWYLSAWAKGAYALLVLLCLAGGAWWMYRRMAHTRQKLEQDKAQALREKEAAFEAEARKSEDEIIRLRNEALRAEVAHKNQELASAAMHLVQKGESLQHIKQELRKVSSQTEGELRRQLLQIIHSIDQDLQLDKNWEQFALHFDQVHEAFLQRLREKYPDLTLREQQLSAYLRMNFSTKEIARLMNISVRGAEIGRYRLRKKLGLDSDTNLVEFIARL